MQRIIFVLVVTLLTGCGNTKSTDTNRSQNIKENSIQQPKPVPVTVTVISQDIMPGIKRALDVRLDKKITKEILADVAVKIKNSDSNKYERTFITYYLPDMEVGAGAWATTHFNPDLEVRVFGLSVEEEKLLRNYPVDPANTIIGSWLEESLKRRTTIFSKDKKIFIQYVYTDGSNGIEELTKKTIDNNATYSEVGSAHPEEYYFIDKNGDLYVGDKEGSWLTGRKL